MQETRISPGFSHSQHSSSYNYVSINDHLGWSIDRRYQQSQNFANLNKSKSTELQKSLLFENSKKKNQTNVASAWSSYQSKKSLLNSVRAQVSAAEIANEGILAEYNSGSDRTPLEVIQSNSLLLNAQISLADSEKSYILSQFNLLKSIGLLNSEYLKIR